MSACKLHGCGCAQTVLSCNGPNFIRSFRPVWPKPHQTLRRHTLASATASATLTRHAEETLLALPTGPLTLDGWLHSGEPSGHASTSTSAGEANIDEQLLLTRQMAEAAEVQRVLEEMSRLMEELDPELTKLRTHVTRTPPRPHLQLQQQQQLLLQSLTPPRTQIQHHTSQQLPASSPRPLPADYTLPQAATGAGSGPSGSSSYISSGSSSTDPLGNALDPLARAVPTSLPVSAVGPVGLALPSLSLPVPGGSGGVMEAGSAHAVAATGAGAAGGRAERRRQNWRRSGAAVVASAAPTHEAKFKTHGNTSVTILMGSFSKDHILSSEEEQRLASAAQDFMALNDVSRLLAAVLKRPPSLPEMARSLQCDEGALRVRLDCGNRARTLLAQRNYRLVVNIAKRAMRAAAGGGGYSASAPGRASGGGAASGSGTGGGGGASSQVGDGGASLDDAITVGMEALMHAIRKFKPEAGYRLSTYAVWWIRLHVNRLLAAQAGVVTMSTYQRANMDRMRAARARLRASLPPGAALSLEAIAEASGLSLWQVEQAVTMERTFGSGARSFEAPISGDGEEGATAEDLVAQDDDVDLSEGGGSSLLLDAEDFAASASLASTVEGLLASLDRGESEALRAEYGLGPAAEEEERRMEEAAAAAAAATAAGTKPGAGSKAGAGGKAAVKPGAERLKLGRKARASAGKALEKLRRSTADDPRLAEWLGLGPGMRSARGNLATRTPGYAKKSKG